MTSRGRAGIGLVTVILALIAGGITLWQSWWQTPPSSAADTLLLIPRGANSREIAAQLNAAGILESPRLFLWGLRLGGGDQELQAGRYRFARPCAPAHLLTQLRRGETEKVWLTLPEGLWLDEAVGRIARELELDSLDLARRVRRPEDWDYPFLAGADNLEGFLCPDTYAFEHPVQAKTVLDELLAAFAASLARLSDRVPEQWAFSAREWVTLASIVEAEALLDSERGRIASVYLNRLDLGMRLEADPTVMYALGVRKPRLYYKHLDVDSPFNTYRHAGLPPGPICSPSVRSLEAVLAGDPGDNSLYFVATGTGEHYFAETLAQHRANVARARKDAEGKGSD